MNFETKVRVLIILLANSFLASYGQKIQTTWFFDQDRFIKIEGDDVSCEPFDFILGYQTIGDTLIFNHKVGSIPDSKFLILKLDADSLFLKPINNSAKAISAKLKYEHYSDVENIVKNPEADDISYLRVIKLYNAITLHEIIKWDTVTLSHSTADWWGTYYFDTKISQEGNFVAVNKYVPYEEKKPAADQVTKTTFYEGKLTEQFLQTIITELNNSGIRRMEKIKFTGWSSHGRRVTLKVSMAKETKLFTAYEYCFPYGLQALVRQISDISRDETLQTTDKSFVIETTFNLPDDLSEFLKQQKIEDLYYLNRSISPLYLRGDFNGDKKADYALPVIERKSNKEGILIYHPISKSFFVAGAGKAIPNSHGDDYQWMDAWQVFDSKKVEQGVGESQLIKLKGKAILLVKSESSSGLIYWDGKEYKWYQQGD